MGVAVGEPGGYKVMSSFGYGVIIVAALKAAALGLRQGSRVLGCGWVFIVDSGGRNAPHDFFADEIALVTQPLSAACVVPSNRFGGPSPRGLPVRPREPGYDTA